LGDLKLKTGEHSWIHQPHLDGIKRILVVCLGPSAEKLSEDDLKTASGKLIASIKQKPIKNLTWSIENTSSISNQRFSSIIAQVFTYGTYNYDETKSKNTAPCTLNKVTLHSESKLTIDWKKGLQRGAATGRGINYAKSLGDLPGNICTPDYLAKQALSLKSDKLTVKNLSEAQMKKLGMNALLSVSAGSVQPAKLIIMEYKGAGAKSRPTVLVGKGVTFDTGGISIKPAMNMDEMKYDMCGAASVFGVMKAVSELEPRINLIGIVAAAENMPNGEATKPGDVVTSMSGQTIEILNTDAEGRLVLCDALSYAERYKPAAVIDIATLTGACVVALGRVVSGLYANNQELAEQLLESGLKAQDRVWQMPLLDDYQKQLDSNFADMANVGSREGGSVTAACFLSRFTKKYPWAHLDIAGTAWNSGQNKGATGRPVGLLMEHLLTK